MSICRMMCERVNDPPHVFHRPTTKYTVIRINFKTKSSNSLTYMLLLIVREVIGYLALFNIVDHEDSSVDYFVTVGRTSAAIHAKKPRRRPLLLLLCHQNGMTIPVDRSVTFVIPTILIIL